VFVVVVVVVVERDPWRLFEKVHLHRWFVFVFVSVLVIILAAAVTIRPWAFLSMLSGSGMLLLQGRLLP